MARFVGADRRDGGGDPPTALLQRGLHRAVTSTSGGGQAGRDRGSHLQGRVALTVGAGWMREEFELLGQEFDNRGKRLNEMIPALRALWRGGWVSGGRALPGARADARTHPPAPVPIMCGGESEAALRRAARLCDGWVGTAYAWDDAVGYVERLHALRREYGREDEPFEIMLALLEMPTADLYKRAEDIGITAVMCAPWMGAPGRSTGTSRPSVHPSDAPATLSCSARPLTRCPSARPSGTPGGSGSNRNTANCPASASNSSGVAVAHEPRAFREADTDRHLDRECRAAPVVTPPRRVRRS